MLCWRSFQSIVHSIYAAINNCFHQDLNLLVVLLLDRDSSLWQSRAQYLVCTVRSHMTKIYIYCQKVHCACYASIHQTVFTRYSSQFTQNLSLTETLGQATSVTWLILSYFFFTHLYLLVSIKLYVKNNLSSCHFDFGIGRVDLGKFGAALTSRCSGYLGSSIPSPYSIYNWKSAAQSSSVSFVLPKSPFRFSQSLVTETRSGEQFSSLLTGWRLILRNRQTLNISICPPLRSFADNAGGKGDHTDSLTAAEPSWCKNDQEALTTFSVSEM